MYRSFTNRILAGICGGLSDWTRIPAWFWRIVWVILSVATFGVATLLYVLLWWVIPQESLSSFQFSNIFRSIFAPVILTIFVLGGWFFRSEFVTDSGQELFLPTVLLLMGIVFFLRQFGGKHTNPILGIIFIAIAGIFLGNTLDQIPDGILDLLFRATPVLLVFMGLSIFLRERIRFGSVIALVLSTALVGGMATVAFTTRATQVRDDNQVIIQEDVDDAISLLQMSIEVQDTSVDILSNENIQEIQAEFVGSTESEIQSNYVELNDGIANFNLEENQSSDFPKLENLGRGHLDVQIPQDVAVAVAFSGGVGNVTFNMSDLNLEKLDISIESGDAVVTLPAYNPLSPSIAQNPGQLTVQDGNIVIILPQNVGARFILDRDRSVRPRFDETLFVLVDDGADGTLESRLFDTFNTRLVYNLNVPSGNIDIRIDTPTP